MEKVKAIHELEDARDGYTEYLSNDAIDMAIEALKTQLSQEGTTSDLISRQAAIDIFDDYNIAVENGELEAYSRDRKRLCNLPTIQPQSTAGQLNDSAQSTNLIDRQAAIDALDCINGVEEVLRSLPTAQPEPKEGHWIEGGIYRDVIECNCSECGQLMTTAATVRMNYCPNCGAKMTISK